MEEIAIEVSKIGWRFDNSYARLPKIMLSELGPIPVKKPELIILNHKLSKELGLNFFSIDEKHISSIFSGNLSIPGSQSIAQAYAGHQFGYFTNLGDGRATLIGEHLTPQNKRFDIQFKGSGQTPYSRSGDGRAALGPMLREYIISEAIHGLGIPTTRSLAVVTTGENVMRESSLPGAILTRVAASHIRVGTFQYITNFGDIKTLKNLLDYSINRHYPNIKNSDNPALELLKSVMEKQAKLITNWMRVGFIHGVMNTDNMTISGETIDYGPCAFMDSYNPKTVFSSIDHQGRYSYANQPLIAQWNLTRFAETLLPLISKKKEKAIKIAESAIKDFSKIYKKYWLEMMRNKLGLIGEDKNDEALIIKLFSLMHKNKADFTNTFFSLMQSNLPNEKLFKDDEFNNWHKTWQVRRIQSGQIKKPSLDLMKKNNPVIIPRNHKVEEVLDAASIDGDLGPMVSLLEALKNPYKNRAEITTYQSPPTPNNQIYQTFCGT